MPYVLSGPRWDNNTQDTPATVTWSFADLELDAEFEVNGYPDFDATLSGGFRDLVRNAFVAWDQVSGIDFIEVSDSLASDIRVGEDFIDGSGGIAGRATWWLDGQDVNVIDLASIKFEPVDAFKDPDFFYLLALHEIGHALGLNHSPAPTDVMYATVGGQPGLSVDDIAGARALYGIEGEITPIASLDALIETSALNSASRQFNNEAQFQGLTAAYVYLGFGVPTINGYNALINNNNTTNFGAGSGVVFNDENIFINTMNALYQGNAIAAATFNSIISGGTALSDKLSLVYDSIIPLAEQSADGRAYFVSQAGFYAARAAELHIPNSTGNGAALVGAAALIKIAVTNDIGGLGDAINDLRSAINNGTDVIPDNGGFTPIETANGTMFDGGGGSSAELGSLFFANSDPVSGPSDSDIVSISMPIVGSSPFIPELIGLI